jgi:NAD-dependent dihydropyrimidine dehydrogenase PreA subunit
MCKVCQKHGAGGKWYLNARNYLKETYEETKATEYLEQLWSNLERAYLNKVYGIMNFKWMSKRVNTPILGRFLKWYANRGFLKDGRKKKLNIDAVQGHFGQVIPLEEAKIVVKELATDTIVKANCPCKYFSRGVKEATCLGFAPLAEVFPKLPRFIPEKGLEVLDGEKAASFLEEMSAKGYVQTLYMGPVPAIVALCNCDYPTCGALRLRDFGVLQTFKGEYVAVVNPDQCIGCKKCASRCQFNALSFHPSMNAPMIAPELCYGCGNCAEVCEEGAITLVDRNDIPITRGKY